MHWTSGTPRPSDWASVLAEMTGENKTTAVREALRDCLERLQGERSGRSLAAELNAIGLHCARQPLLDRRSPDEILGYEATGLPSPR